jgi:vacuolar-type H+-ATPase subunit C/Vma6
MAENTVATRACGGVDAPMDFLNANLRGRRPRIYEGEKLNELAEKKSLEGIWKHLYPRQTAAGRLVLERNLRQDSVEELCSVARLLPTNYRRFYRSLLQRFQMDNILVLLRLFCGSNGSTHREDYVRELPPIISIESDRLLSSSSLESFLDALPEPFDNASEFLDKSPDQYDTTAYLEMAIEKTWWEYLGKVLQDVPFEYRSQCSGPIRYELDSKRLLTILRASRHYDFDWDEIAPMLPTWPTSSSLGSGLSLSQRRLRKLFDDPSAENVVNLIGTKVLRKEDCENLADLEDSLWAKIYHRANRLYYGVMEGPAIMVSYYYVRLNELKSLTGVVESVYYGNVSSR